MNAHFYHTTDGLASYEIPQSSADLIPKLADLLEAKFGFARVRAVAGLEQVFIDLQKAELNLSVGWDIWSGAYLQALNKASEKAVYEIGQYLTENQEKWLG